MVFKPRGESTKADMRGWRDVIFFLERSSSNGAATAAAAATLTVMTSWCLRNELCLPKRPLFSSFLETAPNMTQGIFCAMVASAPLLNGRVLLPGEEEEEKNHCLGRNFGQQPI